MNRINILDKDTFNKIAAGEVVERPASVIKELIENSIDANSKNIHIYIEDGGKRSMRVVDDGDGIHKDDIEKAFMPHSTSKINSIEDIEKIKSMGFRGEALASIASVAKVNLKSKIESEDMGREIEIWGGSRRFIKDVGIPQGTQIYVFDIFFSMPARLKFLKSHISEFSYIIDVVTRIALGNLNISFNLYKDGKKVLFTNGKGSLREAVLSIYGKNFSENLIDVLYHKDLGIISGVVGEESISRGNRNNQTLFVNSRYIKNRMLSVAVENAFKSFIMVNKFPFFILNIELFPDLVDINVHPQKMEVKFLKEREVFSLVFEGVHLALKEYFKKEKFEIHTENDNYTPYEEAYQEKIDISEVEIPYDLRSKNPAYDKEKNKNVDFLENKVEKFTFSDKLASKDTIKFEFKREAKFPKLQLIGQFNKSYIISQHEDLLYIIDQHAAHEKINFEKYVKDITERKVVSQILMIPEVIELTQSEVLFVYENKIVFETCGFLFEDFGENTIVLKEVPLFIGNISARSIFMDVLENLQAMGSGKEIEVRYNKIASIACKSSVKAMEDLSEEEMISLMDDLRFLDEPFTCPHGRPTIIVHSVKDIERWFKRI